MKKFMAMNKAISPIKNPSQKGRAAGLPTPAFDGDEHPGQESPFEATLNAVILYDTFDFAALASAMLKRAAQRADETIPWSVSPWRVDILKLPPASEAALAEAAEAHLILLALRRVQSILPCLVDWLEQWAARRRFQEAALAVWGGGSAETLPARAAPTLMPFASRHGLRLILDEEHARTEDTPVMCASAPEERQVS